MSKEIQHSRFALEAGRIGSWEWNIKSNAVTWSDNLEEIHGMKPGTFNGTFESFIHYVHPADREQLQATIQHSVEADEPYQIEHRWVRKNGEIIWLEAKGKVVYDEQGQPKKMVGICMDITQRKQTERALLKSKAKYQALFNSMDEGFCIIEILFDKNGRAYDYIFLEVNSSFGKLLNLEGAEGKKARDVIPNLENYWVERYAKVAKTGESIHFDDYLGAIDRWLNVHAFRIGDPAEHKVAILFKDITEKREKARTDALLGAIVNDSDDAIVSKNLDGIVTSWNIGAERMFGYTNEEMVGQPITLIIPDERLDEEDMILEKIKNGERVEHYVTKRHCKYGSLIDVSLTISPIKDQSGKVIGASKIARDITEQKRAEEKLEERVEERTASMLAYQNQLRSLAMQLSKAEEQERQQLASNLHDNLGQVLAIGKMKISLLQKQLDNEELAELSELVDDAITYTRELMSDLKPPPSMDKQDLKTAVEWVVKKLEKYDLEVMVEEADPYPKPLLEEVRYTLLRSIRELLFNVVKHAGVNKAWVKLYREGNRVKVVVEDKGRGFDPEERRPESLDKGFGLFSIDERMDFMDGNLQIESTLGEGTRMILTVPLLGAEEELDQTSETEQPTKNESTAPIKILLADDHQIVREGLRKVIDDEEDMVVVAEASNGEEVVKMTGETQPDVVVMDVEMQGVSGDESIMGGIITTQKVKEAFPEIHIIGLSSYDDGKTLRSMLNAGAATLVTKSDAVETLCVTIRSEAMTMKE